MLQHDGVPNRVVINNAGEAVAPRRACRDYRITCDVIFIRSDGWELGAPASLEGVAHVLWMHEWFAFARKTAEGWDVRPIAQYIAR